MHLSLWNCSNDSSNGEIPRYTSPRDTIQEVVPNCLKDASKDGTSTAVYAVFKQRVAIPQGLLSSKVCLSKWGLSIPRLELVACLMSSNQMKNTIAALSQYSALRTVAWSNSTVTLHWILGEGSYKQFVRNWVPKIRKKVLSGDMLVLLKTLLTLAAGGAMPTNCRNCGWEDRTGCHTLISGRQTLSQYHLKSQSRK